MSIADAARATRKYSLEGKFILDRETDEIIVPYRSLEAPQAVCDRLNLLAVLEAIRDPRIMKRAMRPQFADGTIEELCALEKLWPSAIDALIAEVREAGNDSD